MILSALSGNSIEEPSAASVQTELIMLSLPAIAGQAIEPLAQLMETAYIGRMGELFFGLCLTINLLHPFHCNMVKC